MELLAALTERIKLPDDFTVETNVKENVHGTPYAEFDVLIKGKVGTTNFVWLIECRDRQETADKPWIEQLVGRRADTNFNKITAVSTSGFTGPARAYANKHGIELREVRQLDKAAFSDWLTLEHIIVNKLCSRLDRVLVSGIGENGSEIPQRELDNFLSSLRGNPNLLFQPKFELRVSALREFERLKREPSNPVYVNFPTDGQRQPFHIRCNYPADENGYRIETPVGLVVVQKLEFFGERWLETILIPKTANFQYTTSDTGELISEVATFASQEIDGHTLTFQIQKPQGTDAVVASVNVSRRKAEKPKKRKIPSK